jgi:hypothetical protein
LTLTTVAVPDAVADAVVYFAAVVAVARIYRKQFRLTVNAAPSPPPRALCCKTVLDVP